MWIGKAIAAIFQVFMLVCGVMVALSLIAFIMMGMPPFLTFYMMADYVFFPETISGMGGRLVFLMLVAMAYMHGEDDADT